MNCECRNVQIRARMNWIIGFPAALWIVYRLSYHLPALSRVHPALPGASFMSADSLAEIAI